MKRVELEQGTQDWLNWRKTVITATDCPAILGTSPYMTAYKCWQRKLGLIEEQVSNERMERGKRLEPEARDLFNRETGLNMESAVVESTEHTYLGASLDGITSCNRFIVEIKCGGHALHEMAKQGTLPLNYMDQIQHQLLVTGAEKAFYYSYDGKFGEIIEVLPDQKFVDKFLPKAKEFWKCIADFEQPALMNSDYKDMSNNWIWADLSIRYNEIASKIKLLEIEKETTRNQLIELCKDQSCSGAGIKISKIVSKGRINYEKIPELNSIDLEKYRKENTQSWKIMIDKSSQSSENMA